MSRRNEIEQRKLRKDREAAQKRREAAQRKKDREHQKEVDRRHAQSQRDLERNKQKNSSNAMTTAKLIGSVFIVLIIILSVVLKS